jgi:hypothetical protein
MISGTIRPGLHHQNIQECCKSLTIPFFMSGSTGWCINGIPPSTLKQATSVIIYSTNVKRILQMKRLITNVVKYIDAGLKCDKLTIKIAIAIEGIYMSNIQLFSDYFMHLLPLKWI